MNILLRCMAGLSLAALALPAQAQLGGLLDKLVPPSMRASEPAAAAAPNKPPADAELPAAATRGSKSTAIAGGAAPAGRKTKDIAAEMAPDRLCNRPQERFNVAEKLAEYGGTEATLRLERLIASDYKYSDLTPEDREMLKYIAQTTVWVPVEVESALGSAFELVSGSGKSDLTEAEEINRQKVAQRLDKLRETVKDFPSSIKLVVDPKMADGAAAKFGGVLQLSKPFLETMVDQPQGGDLVLAHELSHIYKRHAVKRMQFELISSAEGWELAKKLLGRAMKGAQSNAIADGLFMMTTTPKLVSFVRNLQLRFSSEQELEADACSVVWLRAAGVDPAPAWDQFITAFAATQSQPGGYASSHPPTAEREANYKDKLSGKATAPGQAKKAPAKAPSGKDKRS